MDNCSLLVSNSSIFSVLVRTSKCLFVCSPSTASFVSIVPNECLLGNSFLVQALSLLVAHRVVVLPHGDVGPLLVDTILPLLGAAPLSPSLFLSLGDWACSQDCTSPCPCLWTRPSSRRTFVSTFAPCHARADHPLREARRPHARTG